MLQACIDDNFKIVKFLVKHGADVNACDNEGWTALHATSSCGFIDIARLVVFLYRWCFVYLIICVTGSLIRACEVVNM